MKTTIMSIRINGVIMHDKQRITLSMTLMDAVFAVCEGNPGAIMAMGRMSGAYPRLDPQSAFNIYTPVLQMDTMGIYAGDIHILYKYVCGANVENMAIVMRGVQMGRLSLTTLKQSIAFAKGVSNVPGQIDFIELKKELQKVLPDFLRYSDKSVEKVTV